MAKFFCAEAARQAQEDMIGSGTPYATYVLVECPTPWAFEALDSSAVPQNLRDLVQEVQRAKLSIRFLLIAPQQRKRTLQTKLLIYQQERQKFVGGYRRSEWDVEDIGQVAALVKGYLAGERTGEGDPTQDIRDILICTHGMHDQCCARYGLPFYRQAIAPSQNSISTPPFVFGKPAILVDIDLRRLRSRYPMVDIMEHSTPPPFELF